MGSQMTNIAARIQVAPVHKKVYPKIFIKRSEFGLRIEVLALLSGDPIGTLKEIVTPVFSRASCQ